MQIEPSAEASHQVKRPFGHERRVRVRSEYIAMLLPFICREETRYWLTGIHVEPHPEGGVLLVATNGHILGVAHDKDGTADGPWTCRIPKAIAQACTARVREALSRPHSVDFIGPNVYVTTAKFNKGDERPDPAQLSDDHLAAAFAPSLDGAFPDWRKVIPAAPEKPEPWCASFNSRYLDAFRDVARVRGSEAITTRPGAHSMAPSIVEVDAVPEFLGVIMPMHGRAADAFRMPTWLTPAPPQMAAAE